MEEAKKTVMSSQQSINPNFKHTKDTQIAKERSIIEEIASLSTEKQTYFSN